MLQIGNTIVSLDLIETFFCCDLDKCKGQCCVEGDAGAPLSKEEEKTLQNTWKSVREYMSEEAISEVEKNSVAYIDSEGDLVTTILNGKDCAFTCYNNGICLCSLEKAYRENKIDNIKPISCSLYPVRLTEYPTFIAVNYHKWNVCEPALEKGKEKGLRLYEFLKEPLIRRFGQEWYDELALTAQVYLEEKKKGR